MHYASSLIVSMLSAFNLLGLLMVIVDILSLVSISMFSNFIFNFLGKLMKMWSLYFF